jgi:hypothetical protein
MRDERNRMWCTYVMRLYALICSHPVERTTQHTRVVLPRGFTKTAFPLATLGDRVRRSKR